MGTIYAVAGDALELVEEGAFGELGAIAQHFTALSAYSFLVFNLLCAPCFAAIGAIKREMNNAKWTWFAIGYQTVFAYTMSFMLYQFGLLFTGAAGFSIGTAIAGGDPGCLPVLLFRKGTCGKTYPALRSVDTVEHKRAFCTIYVSAKEAFVWQPISSVQSCWELSCWPHGM